MKLYLSFGGFQQRCPKRTLETSFKLQTLTIGVTDQHFQRDFRRATTSYYTSIRIYKNNKFFVSWKDAVLCCLFPIKCNQERIVYFHWANFNWLIFISSCGGKCLQFGLCSNSGAGVNTCPFLWPFPPNISP